MAGRAKPDERRNAQLSREQMQAAIPKIERRLRELQEFDISSINSRSDPRIQALEHSLADLLDKVFGTNTIQYYRYLDITNLDRTTVSFDYDTSIQEFGNGLKQGIESAITTLKTIMRLFTEELEDAGVSGSGRALRAYEGLELHSEIERAVGQLYRDGHYAEAVEKAVKVLNGLVRVRSGEEIDGTALMEKVFSPNNPILKFSTLSDQSDRDEQKGFMMLFSGAVAGLRNPRAHKIIQDDPERALEFIAFISLLAKLLDEAS